MMIVMTIAPIIAPTLGARALRWMNWEAIFVVLSLYWNYLLFMCAFLF